MDYEELYKWIEEHTITRPKRNINRDFSDAVPLAEILKHHYPKLVDLHNYSSRNSHSQKLINWETLNSKVLKKLKINLSKKRIDLLAKGELGEIEKLLSEIKKKIETQATLSEHCEVHYLESLNVAASGDKTPARRMVPPSVVEKLKSELDEKNDAVKILKNKLDHLENLLSIKDERIRDLNEQLETTNKMPRPESPAPSKFFGFFQTSNSAASVEQKSEML